MLLKPIAVAQLLSSTVSGLNKLEKKDPSFPRKIKFSQSRQGAAFYDEQEILEWIESKKAARVATVAEGGAV